jgi:hypothetical protein
VYDVNEAGNHTCVFFFFFFFFEIRLQAVSRRRSLSVREPSPVSQLNINEVQATSRDDTSVLSCLVYTSVLLAFVLFTCEYLLHDFVTF